MSDAELTKFKTEIDLRVYAAGHGYELDRKKSWRGSAVMRHANGDKIAIKRDVDGHYLYYSFRDDKDHGSVIDFVQKRQNLTLGAVRKELRRWLGVPEGNLPRFEPMARTAKDRITVEAAFAKMARADRHPYLEFERCIPGNVLAGSRFAGRIYIDARGNAVFPHYDGNGLAGYELKNRGWTGFSPGGTKTLWSSNEAADDRRIVFVESSIDGLSHAALFPDDRTRYKSLSGRPSPAQCGLIRDAIAAMPGIGEVVAAMDSDTAGEELTAFVQEAFDLAARQDLAYRVHRPESAKDWNDVLRAAVRGRAADANGGPSLV